MKEKVDILLVEKHSRLGPFLLFRSEKNMPFLSTFFFTSGPVTASTNFPSKNAKPELF